MMSLDEGKVSGARAQHEPSPVRVPLQIDGGAAGIQPLTFGLPFPRGLLADPGQLCLLDPEARLAALQTLPLAHWPDGSVKWLLLDMLVPSLLPGSATWSLVLGGEGLTRPTSPSLRTSEDNSELTVTTGPATFGVACAGPQLLARAVVGNAAAIGPDGLRVVLTDRNGRKVRHTIERCTLEASGPIRATVRLEGVFAGRAKLRFVARLSFFAGTALVRVALTLHNPERAGHSGGLWDLGDAGSVLFRDLSLHLGLPNVGEVAWTAEPGQPLRSAVAVEIYQDSSGGENWRSRNHVNREGRVPCSFRGYRVRAGSFQENGLRANPVVRAGTTMAALPEFWQQFPKAIGVSGSTLRVGLFPQEFGDLHELQGGEQKAHVLWLDHGWGASADSLSLTWVHQPARVSASSEWYADSGAFPYLVPRSHCEGRPVEAFLQKAISGSNNLLARREVIDEYGWRHYGDLYADHEVAHYRGPPPIISHYNNQYDVIYGAILQYLRSGDARWVELFDPLARHVMDIDVYHTDRDRPAYNGGLFWHTDHYRDAATCSHRSYSRANQQSCRPYGGGPANEHNYTTGLLHYYYLTGEPAARDAVLSLADWVIAMEDGRRTPLGLLDDGPTGKATSTADPNYHGPGRGAGNSINALLDAWLLTGRLAYLEHAEGLMRRVIHPLDDVNDRELLNVEARWSYTVFLVVLTRYLHCKAEAGVLDRAYAYAQASLVRYASWMVDHEVPYFDQSEKLEFPTETWAAQEFRKANVLRMASAHVEDPLRSNLIRRGDELARRAWQDLTQFDHPATARALALLLVEGMRDSYFAQGVEAPAPRSPEGDDFGAPEVFLPQRVRALSRLKSVRGLVRGSFRLLDPRRWWRLWRRQG